MAGFIGGFPNLTCSASSSADGPLPPDQHGTNYNPFWILQLTGFHALFLFATFRVGPLPVSRTQSSAAQ
jgi:hypothetical protein